MKLGTATQLLLFLSSFSLCTYLGKAEIEGQVRLTGLTIKLAGRLEVFLNGAWGTVCSDLTNGAYNRDLGYGKTVCSQLNHYNSQSMLTEAITGTVKDLNEILRQTHNVTIDVSAGTNHYSMHGIGCLFSAAPSHILRCIWQPASKCKNHDHDLGLICDPRTTNWENPYVGQIRLKNTDSPDLVNKGTLEVYSGNNWGNVCYKDFDQGSANSACRQLGYTNAKTFNKTATKTATTVWLSEVSCGSTSKQCLWECLGNVSHSDLYHNKTKSCSDKQYVALECVFNVSLRDSMTSLTLGRRTCAVQPFTYTSASLAIIVIIVAVVAVVIACVAVCSCCVILLRAKAFI